MKILSGKMVLTKTLTRFLVSTALLPVNHICSSQKVIPIKQIQYIKTVTHLQTPTPMYIWITCTKVTSTDV